MKRIISLTLVVLFVAALLVACGGSSDPVGEYVVKSIGGKTIEDVVKAELDGTGVDVDAYLKTLKVDSLAEMFTIELKSDGTAKAVSPGEEQSGTWKQDGDKITVTIDNDPREFTFSNGELKSTQDGEEYVFTKK